MTVVRTTLGDKIHYYKVNCSSNEGRDDEGDKSWG